ncbi:MAG: Crp/Fnr family transcriptional regulator [Vulcanimicrobiota bacterium]
MSRTGIRKFPLFANLSDCDVESLMADLQLRVYAGRQRIFDMGEPARGLYFLDSGKVKVFRVSREGTEQILGVFETGGEFALAAAFNGGGYPASAETLEPSKIYFLDREALLRQIQDKPELALRLLSSMSKKMHGLVSLIDSLSLRDARGRLSRYLAGLLPPESEETPTLELPMSKTLLSHLLGLKMETLSRTFRALVNEGVLGTVDRGKIQVLDRATLVYIAGDEQSVDLTLKA